MTDNRSHFFKSPLVASLVVGASLIGAAALHRTADSAPSQVAPAPVSVAFCDVARVINTLKEFEKEQGMNRLKREGFIAKLKETSDEIEKMKSDLKENKIPAKDYGARAEAMGKIDELSAVRKSREEVYNLQIDFAVADSFNRLYIKAVEAVGSLAKKEGIDIVLLDDRAIPMPELGTARTGKVMDTMENKRVMYAREGLDITDRVINLMNEQFLAGGNQPATFPVPAPAPAPRNP
jgi:Skp family chaperone for outer membrane proteins